eukprot:1951341-Ditylum_brightwellii.AAC.1
MSRNLRFISIEALQARKIGTVTAKLEYVIRMYHHRGFKVTAILGDHKFEALRPKFPMVNTAAADEHVSDIERCIREY